MCCNLGDFTLENVKTPIVIFTEYVTVGQFLKLAAVISSGGEAKSYLASHDVLVDGAIDNRRGRKLYPGTLVQVEKRTFEIVAK